ncbi:BMP/retinoic acid-inducible neural-specific protein 3 isoform X1 [Silurus asotus]|uniref:BMP/retinoic acid-inducible neural-specific protein 3 isoform X1 n=1 Tax=Silurus asotus TaxID=30991 RepID=A0AAD5AAC8_SILAS|nr:BMP/retinoic acid-inducible neural-specific protein 3 isoform X1 [Silurus asotus]
MAGHGALRALLMLVAAGTCVGAAERLAWLLADKGPFRRAHEFTEFHERHQHGFTTRYKIYREFGRWKVNNLAMERQESVPFDPEFARNIRQLGRRPSLQMITDTIIKKYGTHFLVSATLGGEESLTIFVDKRKLSEAHSNSEAANGTLTLEALHHLAASYFIDRDSTLRKLHHLQIASAAIKVTETRTGPLGCSNYDNLDSVSSVLAHSPENRIQLQGLQVLLPEYLRSRFVQAALSYISCNSEGRFTCRNNDCWCQCSEGHPKCNCPYASLRAQHANLEHANQAWKQTNLEFEQSDEFQAFMVRLLTHGALNSSSVWREWRSDVPLQKRYRKLESDAGFLVSKAQESAAKLFSLGRRCRSRPQIILPRERHLGYWLQHALSLLYCGEAESTGIYSEVTRSCVCPGGHLSCQGSIPCSVGTGSRCASCSTENRTRCSSCNSGFALSHGLCRPAAPSPTKQYLSTETEIHDSELRDLLEQRDSHLTISGVFVSSDVKLNTWFEPSLRKRMLLTLKSNKSKSSRVHMLLGILAQICVTKNSTLEPTLSVSVNPFGGSHSESWTMPMNQNGYPDWEKTRLDSPMDCYNWTLMLGNRWKSFFETVHFYLRSRIQSDGNAQANETAGESETANQNASQNAGYMKMTTIQLFGYSVNFDPEAIRDLILQLDYPYTHGSQDSALQELMEIRYRVNRLSPAGPMPLDLFSCLLRHRLKLSTSEVSRILAALQSFGAKHRYYTEYEVVKLCS